jgi:hypothetical protein
VVDVPSSPAGIATELANCRDGLGAEVKPLGALKVVVRKRIAVAVHSTIEADHVITAAILVDG